MDGKPFVFISYPSEDKKRVAYYVDHLKQAGIEVWWDSDLESTWSSEIGRALESCALVIGFVTKHSSKRTVLVEFESGLEQDKLLPVVLDEFRAPYDLKVAIYKLSQILLYKSENDGIRDLIKRIHTRLQHPDVKPIPETLNVGQADGFERLVSNKDFEATLHYRLALSIFQDWTYGLVSDEAQKLKQYLCDAGWRAEKFHLDELTTRTKILELIDAKVYDDGNYSPLFASQFVRFKNPDHGLIFLKWIWDEIPIVREPLSKYMTSELAAFSIGGDRMLARSLYLLNQLLESFSLSLSIFAQVNFASVKRLFLDPWLNDEDNPSLQLAADMTIALLMDRPECFEYFEAQLDACFENEDMPAPVLKRGLRLLSGFTGLKLFHKADKYYSAIEQRLYKSRTPEQFFSILEHVSESFSFYGKIASQSEVLRAGNIEYFRTSAAKQRENQRMTSFIHDLIIMTRLKLFSADQRRMNHSALETLINDDDPTLSRDIAYLISERLCRGNVNMRESFKKLIDKWIAEANNAKHIISIEFQVAFKKFFEHLEEFSPTLNDKSRIRYFSGKIKF